MKLHRLRRVHGSPLVVAPDIGCYNAHRLIIPAETIWHLLQYSNARLAGKPAARCGKQASGSGQLAAVGRVGGRLAGRHPGVERRAVGRRWVGDIIGARQRLVADIAIPFGRAK